MKRLLPIALIVIAGFYFLRYLMSLPPRVQTAQALAGAVTVAPTSTPRPTDTPVSSPTIGYQETAIVAQQTAMEAVRVNAAITAEFERRVQEQLQMTAAAEYQYFVVIGWTQTAAPTSIALTATQQAVANTQIAGQQTLEAGRLTATAQAPTMIVAVSNSMRQVKNSKLYDSIFVIGTSSLIFLAFAGGFFLLRKAVTLKTVDIVRALQDEEYNPADYEPVPAQTGVLEIPTEPEQPTDGINRRMEQRFAQVLLAMHQLKPNDEAVNLLESFWIVRGARDKFQNRTEFLAVRDEWAHDENGILLRVDKTLKNSPFYVAKWDEVRSIANGERLQPLPQGRFVSYSTQKQEQK